LERTISLCFWSWVTITGASLAASRVALVALRRLRHQGRARTPADETCRTVAWGGLVAERARLAVGVGEPVRARLGRALGGSSENQWTDPRDAATILSGARLPRAPPATGGPA
jgi:hypothetical protein